MDWRLVSAVLCLYGFLKEFRLIGPYLYDFHVTVKNFTAPELYGRVYPFWTYSYLVALIPVFLLTDLLRYKPVIILESLAYLATWSLIIWGQSLFSQQLMQICYGWATATEIAYFAYVYAVVEPRYFQCVTSYSRAALQAGQCSAFVLSQAAVLFRLASFQALNVVTLVSLSTTLPLSLLLPWAGKRRNGRRRNEHADRRADEDETAAADLDEHGLEKENSDSNSNHSEKGWFGSTGSYFAQLLATFRDSYSSAFVWKWSIWWAVATCGNFQVGNYIQTLWGTLQSDSSDVYNGVVEAVSTALATVTILLMQFVTVEWERWGELALTIISAADCVILVAMAYVRNLFLVYLLYVVFRVLFQMIITIAQFNLAKKVLTESFGLVFGFNTFLALVMQTLLTLLFADASGFHLDIRSQFFVYGCYHGLAALFFLVTGIWTVSTLSDEANSRPPSSELPKSFYKSLGSCRPARRDSRVPAQLSVREDDVPRFGANGSTGSACRGERKTLLFPTSLLLLSADFGERSSAVRLRSGRLLLLLTGEA